MASESLLVTIPYGSTSLQAKVPRGFALCSTASSKNFPRLTISKGLSSQGWSSRPPARLFAR